MVDLTLAPDLAFFSQRVSFSPAVSSVWVETQHITHLSISRLEGQKCSRGIWGDWTAPCALLWE
jgi:hypothetical protein